MGDIVKAKAHYDLSLALYDTAMHRSLAMQFGQDHGVSVLSFRSEALFLLGYPEAALADTEKALIDARLMGHGATLLFALAWS